MASFRMVGRRAAAALAHGGAQKVAFALGHAGPKKFFSARFPSSRGIFSTRQCSKDDPSGGATPGDDPPNDNKPSGVDSSTSTHTRVDLPSGTTTGVVPYCGSTTGGAPSVGASSGGHSNAVVLRGGAPRCSAPCCPLPCCIALGRGIPSGLQVVEDFRTRELELAKVARHQNEERIRQNLVNIDQAVSSDNLKLRDSAIQLKQKEQLQKAEDMKTRALQKEKEDIKLAEIQAKVAADLRDWEKDVAKKSEDLDAREAAAKEQHQVGLVLEIQGVRIKVSDVTIKESEHARLREVMKVQDASIGKESKSKRQDESSIGKKESKSKSKDESGSTGGKKQSWYDWYKELDPEVKLGIWVALLIICDCYSPPSPGEPGIDSSVSMPGDIEEARKIGRAVIEEFLERFLEAPRKFLKSVRDRIAAREKKEEEEASESREKKEEEEASESNKVEGGGRPVK